MTMLNPSVTIAMIITVLVLLGLIGFCVLPAPVPKCCRRKRRSDSSSSSSSDSSLIVHNPAPSTAPLRAWIGTDTDIDPPPVMIAAGGDKELPEDTPPVPPRPPPAARVA
ncbi:hypothetical protein F4777DRAFT_576368 [Nemania sp. FL0916]|nr:hypothetical protein F4777DRAFT_576368 [Nemania sp. FL0916]